jgi:hypothetical protein
VHRHREVTVIGMASSDQLSAMQNFIDDAT